MVFIKKSLVLAGWALPAILAVPEPTPAARLENRQASSASAVTSVWSPSIINGQTVTWQSFLFIISGATRTVTSSSNFWGWCATTTSSCALPTTCSNGTVYFPSSSSVACATDNPLCGTEFLFSTSGASSKLTRHACFPTTDAGRVTSNYLLTPPASQVSGSSSSSSSSSSQSPSSSPSSSSGSSTNVGAIVGGVIGGLAVLVIAILAIFFLLRHRKKQNAAAAAAGAPTANGAQPSPYGGNAAMAQTAGAGGYYAGSPGQYPTKHASYAADYPAGSPPPQYPNSAVPGQQNYYPAPGSVAATSPHPEGFASAGHSPGQNYGAPVMGHDQTSYAAELPGQSAPAHGAHNAPVELDSGK